jgi:hypothetical protein
VIHRIVARVHRMAHRIVTSMRTVWYIVSSLTRALCHTSYRPSRWRVHRMAHRIVATARTVWYIVSSRTACSVPHLVSSLFLAPYGNSFRRCDVRKRRVRKPRITQVKDVHRGAVRGHVMTAHELQCMGWRRERV